MSTSRTALGRDQLALYPPDISRDEVNGTCLEYFRQRIEASHFQTLCTAPTILHWDSVIGDLSPWKWPVDLLTGHRVAPSELEVHRETHHFRAPSCLCAQIDQDSYSESRIGLVHVPIKLTAMSSFNGEYTAECANRRCGYLETPLPSNGFNYNSGARDICPGLQKVMPTHSVRTRGVKRDRLEEPYGRSTAARRILAMLYGTAEGPTSSNDAITQDPWERKTAGNLDEQSHHCGDQTTKLVK
ncbi:hypothetical protein BKA70DRAFT_1478526 [Coprinopsis sp. MPI-PUGE-AT-0042]|nr:hypothetical protein BKA70DRAFT_1478526 [Coprinopsis sp. MPI-PUGE-AT-0042]